MIKKYFYRKKFEAQFVDGLTLIANAVKAGLSLQQAIEMAADEMPRPFCSEMAQVISEVKMGASIEDALKRLSSRLVIDDLNIVVQSVCILRETGGNIVETFQLITNTIRERQKVEGRIKVLTSQGITQGVIILCMPFFLSFILYFVSPDFILPLFKNPLGWGMILIALSLQCVGAFFIKKIVNVKI